MIDEVIVQPFCLPQCAFELKAEPLGNRPAPPVPSGDADLYTVEPEVVEGMLKVRLTSSRHQGAALVPFGQPVSERGRPVRPIDLDMSDHSSEVALVDQRRLKAIVLPELLLCSLNERRRIFR